ncbi:hypothetical protein ACSMX9_25150 [Streptomyces sp. LE64]
MTTTRAAKSTGATAPGPVTRAATGPTRTPGSGPGTPPAPPRSAREGR